MTIHIHPTSASNSAPRVGARPARLRPARLRAAVLAGVTCALTCAPAAAHELPTYRALVDALMDGQSVTALLDLSLCTRDGTDAHGPKIQGGSRITRFLVPNGQYVAFADTHHTLDTEDRPVVEYIRYRAMPDGSATVSFARQAAASDKATPRGQFQCSFTRGIRFVEGEAPRAHPLRTHIQAPDQTPPRKGDADTQHPANRGEPDQ